MTISLGKGIKYMVKSPDNCEYSDMMQKIYAKKPEIDKLGCRGYRNRYTDGISRVCAECCFLSDGKGEENE